MKIQYCEDCEHIILAEGWEGNKPKQLEFSKCSKAIDTADASMGLCFVAGCFGPPEPNYNFCNLVRRSKGGGECENFKVKSNE